MRFTTASTSLSILALSCAVAAAQSPPQSLPPITVEAQAAKPKAKQKAAPQPVKAETAPVQPPPREKATGPVQGIVATRSATGTKFDAPLLETPQSISVVTADQITQQRATTLSEALNYTPGVSTGFYGIDSRFDWISIRGFSAYLPGVFLDGMLMRNNDTWSVWKVEPYGAERIEVMKGPPSVLYGQGNVGGMLNVVSKMPLDKPLNEVEVRLGNYNRLETAFDFSGPATSDGKLLYRLTGTMLNTNAQVDFAEQKRVFIAPSFTWRPNSSTSLTFLSQYSKDDTIPSQGTYLPNPHAEVRRSLFIGDPSYDKFDREQWAVGYQLEHKFDDTWQIRNKVRLSSVEVDYKTLYSAGLSSTDPSVLNRYAFTSRETATLLTTDTHVQANFATGPLKHTLVAGIDYQNNDFRQRSGFGSGPSLDLDDPVYGVAVTDPAIYNNSKTVLSQTGLYVQDQAKLGGLILTLGGRYDWAKTEIENYLDGTSPEVADRAATWKAAVMYRTASGLAPYYTYATSFFPVGALNPATGNAFAPETGQMHEVGLKYQPTGSKALYTLAAFDITRQNHLTYDNAYTAHQLGEIKSRGIELEAKAELAPGLDLIAAYTWLPDFEITKSASAAEVGKRQPMVAEHSAKLWLHYTHRSGPLQGFGYGGGVRYIGESYGDIANSDDMKAPDYTLFDAVVDFERNGWKFALNVNNIADEKTITCWDGCYVGTGRTIIGSIKHRW
ncbi:MAG: TonB-dependent siderophore receptor [Hyphomicrobiaceae bacterium]|nr:TonB-dependent siderophore receptor [Hyphomicrobiaceae bacterium]